MALVSCGHQTFDADHEVCETCNAELLKALLAWFPSVAQLLDGWRQSSEPEAWTAFDQEVRDELSRLHAAFSSQGLDGHCAKCGAFHDLNTRCALPTCSCDVVDGADG